MEATNTKLNGNSETYKTIFIYQSMSGDAEVGTSSFTSKNSKIINNKGDMIFVTNTNTVIELENNEFINNDETGIFLKISASKWGTSGSNGGTETLNAKNQKIEGNILVDNISTLDLSLKNGSSYKGTINNENTAKSLKITLDSSSNIRPISKRNKGKSIGDYYSIIFSPYKYAKIRVNKKEEKTMFTKI